MKYERKLKASEFALILTGYILYIILAYTMAFIYNSINHKLGHLWKGGPHLFIVLAPLAMVYSYVIIYSVRKVIPSILDILIIHTIVYVTTAVASLILTNIKDIEIPFNSMEVLYLILPLVLGAIFGYLIGMIKYNRMVVKSTGLSKNTYKSICKLYKLKRAEHKKCIDEQS